MLYRVLEFSFRYHKMLSFQNTRVFTLEINSPSNVLLNFVLLHF